MVNTITKSKFAKMGRRGRASAIARDVLYCIENDLVRPDHIILEIDPSDLPEEDISLHSYANSDRFNTCHACAIGASLLSLCRIAWKGVLAEASGYNTYLDEVEEVFKDDFYLIEYGYELGDGLVGVVQADESENEKPFVMYSNYDIYFDDFKFEVSTEKAFNAAYKFCKKYKSSKKRLAAIMQNIVDNKGRFKPWRNL